MIFHNHIQFNSFIKQDATKRIKVLLTLSFLYAFNSIVFAITPSSIELINPNANNKQEGENISNNTTLLEINIGNTDSITLEQNSIAPSSDISISQHYIPQKKSNEIQSETVKYSGGSGTSADPYLIKDAYDLIFLSQSPSDWTKNFYQIDDILFTTPSEFDGNLVIWSDIDGNGNVSSNEIDFNMDGDFTNDTNGFLPIGNEGTKFSGNYSGHNINSGLEESYLIDHLYINRPSTDHVGLFGYCKDNIIIKYITISNSYVHGRYHVGMCCGEGDSKFSRIKTSGIVIGKKRVGGIVGNMDSGSGYIAECGNNATIVNNGTGSTSIYDGQHTGGVGGYVNANIRNSYNTGYIYSSKTSGGNTGGISGTLFKTTTSCYSSGTISGKSNVGGIAGTNNGTLKQVSVSGYVYGTLNNIGAIVGMSTLSNVIKDAAYDSTVVQLTNAVGKGDQGNTTKLSTSEYNNKYAFNFYFGNDYYSPWKINTNLYGRPYLYWQDAFVSNPLPEYTALGFQANATYTGTLQTQNPTTPELTNKGVRITNVNDNGEASWNNQPWEWHHIYTDSVASTTFTTIQSNILTNNQYFLVQPFVITSDGQKRYGDMVKMKAHYFLNVLTGVDSQRKTTSTTLNGTITSGSNVTEYGVIYSKDINTMTLEDISNTTPIVERIAHIANPVINVSPSSPFNFSLTLEVDDLTNRKNYYTRAYAIDETDSIVYGEIKRFITEKRDFSLDLDGNSALLADATSTSNYINDWSNSIVNEFSIEFWLKNDGNTNSEQVILDNHSNISGYTVSLSVDGKINLSAQNGSKISTSASITDDLWHYVAISYDGTNALIQLDSNASTGGIIIEKPDTLSSNLCIGAELNGTVLTKNFTGKIDALRFWNTALSSQHILKLCYDNIESSNNGFVKLKGSGIEIENLAWENLTAAIGFNVKSTLETDIHTIPANYNSESDGYDYPFFAEEGQQHFNLIAIGSPRPSNYLPRTNWSFTATNNSWLSDLNWSSFAFPGQGIHFSELSIYTDITNSEIATSGDFCQYTIINKVDDNLYSKPLINSPSPFIHYLVDYDKDYKSYRVDDNNTAQLTIKGGVISDLFESESGIIINNKSFLIESGSIEVQ